MWCAITVDFLIAFGKMSEFKSNVISVKWKWLNWLIFLNVCIVSFISELPTTKPTLWTERDRYEPGEVLVANCSSPPSQPRVELKLSINNMVVSENFCILKYPKTASLYFSFFIDSNVKLSICVIHLDTIMITIIAIRVVQNILKVNYQKITIK